MPKSKHRKNAKGKKLLHKKKFTYSTIWLPEEQINAIKNLFLHAEMVAEIKLVRGMCTYDDVACMRDTMNFCSWCSVYLYNITKTLNEDWIKDSYAKFLEAQDAFHTYYQRGIKAGAIENPDYRFVATGEESVKIRDGMLVAGDVCQQMLSTAPKHFIRLFCAMKDYLAGRGPGRLEYNSNEIEQKIKRVLHGC